MKVEQIPTPYCGLLKVYVDGDLCNRTGKVVLMTVHDVGGSYLDFGPFFESKHMVEVRKRVILVHICLPGQDDYADELPDSFQFPSMEAIANDLLHVVNYLKISTVIGFGEGAGANILCRFGLLYPNRSMGLVLIDCTPSSAGMDEVMLQKLFNWKEGGSKLVEKMMEYLSQHKQHGKRPFEWKGRINALNVGKRTSLSHFVIRGLKVETLLLVGSKFDNLDSVYKLNRLSPRTTTMAIVDGVTDCLFQAPFNVARAFILFCKSCGVLLGVPMLGLESEFARVKVKLDENGNKTDTEPRSMGGQKNSAPVRREDDEAPPAYTRNSRENKAEKAYIKNLICFEDDCECDSCT